MSGSPTLDKSNQPMLDRLCPDYQGVVSFEVSVDKQSIKIIEACDRYFAETFSKTEFQQLIEELKTLHGKMVD